MTCRTCGQRLEGHGTSCAPHPMTSNNIFYCRHCGSVTAQTGHSCAGLRIPASDPVRTARKAAFEEAANIAEAKAREYAKASLIGASAILRDISDALRAKAAES